tara:strand:- start:551 stop:850 length:300 start_codon:yes stop_codon:yes gene_type:complete
MKIKKRENFGMKRTKQRKAMLRSGNFNSYSVPRSKKNIILDKMMSGLKKGANLVTPGVSFSTRPVKTHKRVTVKKGSFFDKTYKQKGYSQYKLSKKKKK